MTVHIVAKQLTASDDVSAYDFATGAEVLALGQNDGLGNSFYALGDGLDFVYVVGRTTNQMQAGDFVV